MKKNILFLLMLLVYMQASIIEDADKAFENKNYKEALLKYKQACDKDEKKGCFRLGFIYMNAKGVKKDINTSQNFYKKSCTLNDENGCFRVGYFYENQKEKKELQKAKEYYERSCNLGKARGCEKVADLYKYGLEGQREDIIKFYKKACLGGKTASCYQLAFMYEQKDFINIQEAEKWHKMGCDGDDIQSCHRLIDMYVKDIASLDVDDKIVSSYTKKCSQNNGIYCYKLAVFYMIGKGVEQDNYKAKEILQNSCEHGDKASCMEFIMLEDRGY